MDRIEQALECLEGIVDSTRWDTDHIDGTDALATLRAELAALREVSRTIVASAEESDPMAAGMLAGCAVEMASQALDRAREVGK